jgi:hypothetical protein
METALLLSLFIALAVNGLYAASEEGKLLHPIDRLLYRILPSWLYLPIIGCVTCMASVWGTLVFALHWLLYPGLSWYWWPFVVLAATGLGVLVYRLIQALLVMGENKCEAVKPTPPQTRTPITDKALALRGYEKQKAGYNGIVYRYQHGSKVYWYLTRNEEDYTIENYVLRWQGVNGQWLETMEQVALYEKAHP